MVVVGKHFPGFGCADRLPEEEVATVRKTLEQLKQFDLFPFFAVTSEIPSGDSAVDALLVSHIRYQGLQENFRQTTKPISFDPQAFSNLASLEPLKSWREAGGIYISDDIGSRAVRRFYDPTGQTYNSRAIALDAFLAGNDIQVYLGNVTSSGDNDSYSCIIRITNSFAQKYREDTAFAERVDDSILRILALKYRIYNNSLTLTSTLPFPERKAELGLSSQVTFEITRQAATLISPSYAELDTAIPGFNDQIVFITDARTYQQCSTCPLRLTMAMVEAINMLTVPIARHTERVSNSASYYLTRT